LSGNNDTFPPNTGTPSPSIRYTNGQGLGYTTTYTYDGLNRQTKVTTPDGAIAASSYSAQTAAIENASTNPCGTCYLSYDHLGTVRMVTDPVFASITRHDYLPFGDEIPGGVAGRNGQFGPYTDNVDEKFTGQVRDAETLNDFFNARYYTAPLMRFLSSDPGNAGADPTDPQTWNGYAYVRNNPLALIDPSGMGWQTTDVTVCTPVISSSISYESGDFFSTGTLGGYTSECHTVTQWTWVADQAVGQSGGGSGGGGGGGGISSTPSTPNQPPKSGIGIRAPGQTFNACMAQHANEYSLGGLVDTSYGLATGKDSSVSTNPLASFVLGNSINTLLFGSRGEAASAALSNAPSAITGGMGNALTYGREDVRHHGVESCRSRWSACCTGPIVGRSKSRDRESGQLPESGAIVCREDGARCGFHWC
jgi:RHS repeat-associated protein